MSDFLGNLISRSFMPAAAIRPRPLSRFESAAEGEALQADLAPEAKLAEQPIPQIRSQAALTPARTTQPIGQRAGGEQPIANDRVQPLPPAIQPSEPRTNQATYEPLPAQLAAPAQALPAANSPAAPFAAPLAGQIAAPPASRDSATRENQLIIERVIVSERRAADLPFTPDQAPARPERVPTQPATPPTTVVPIEPPESQQQRAPYAAPATAAQPQPAPRAESSLTIRPAATLHSEASLAPAALTPRAPDAPAPTIQVTIGRIEVRAAPPTRTPQSARSGPAVMSLDEYLRRRGQEGNR